MDATLLLSEAEKDICAEIRAWSKEALEKPSTFFRGLPPCPYAKQAWFDNRVAFLFKNEDSYQCLWSAISQFEDTFDLVILVDRKSKQSADEFHGFLDGVNDAVAAGILVDKDIWVMGFHPDDDANEFVADVDFSPLVEEPYAIIFVQRLSKLQVAADKLAKIGYYGTYDGLYDASSIFTKRSEFYRRLKNGDETH